MLAKAHRIRTADEFRAVSRRGRRKRGRFVLVHVLQTDDESVTRFGFVVSRASGNAVMRNTIKRRLRGIAREMLQSHPVGLDVVVRAQKNTGVATYWQLRSDVESALGAHVE